MLKRRLRSLLLAAAGGALVGGVFGTTWALLAVMVADSNADITVTPNFPGAVFVVPLVWGAMLGAVSGATFGLLLMVAERGRGIAQLRRARVALWAAVSAAVALRLGGGSWALVGIGSVIGAAIGAAGISLAKRGGAKADTDNPTLAQAEASVQLPEAQSAPIPQQHASTARVER